MRRGIRSGEVALLVYVKKGHTVDFVGEGCLNDLILLFASRFLNSKTQKLRTHSEQWRPLKCSDPPLRY